MPRDGLIGSGLATKLSARAIGIALAGVVFVWLFLGSSVGGFGLGAARGATVGTITEFPLPTPANQPRGIAAGTDGDLWLRRGDGRSRRAGRGRVPRQ